MRSQFQDLIVGFIKIHLDLGLTKKGSILLVLTNLTQEALGIKEILNYIVDSLTIICMEYLHSL